MVEFHGELDPLSPGEEVIVEAEAEQEVSGGIISYDELKRRMWKDKLLLEKLKQKGKFVEDQSKSSSSSASAAKEEYSRRKKMARAQDSILKYMVKIMEVCKAQVLYMNFYII